MQGKKKRYLFRCPDRLYGVLADRGAKSCPFLADRGTKMSPFLAKLIEFQFPWNPRDKFHLEKNPFEDEGTTQIAIRMDTAVHREFRKFVAEYDTNMTRVLIQWLIEEPEIAEALRQRKWI